MSDKLVQSFEIGNNNVAYVVMSSQDELYQLIPLPDDVVYIIIHNHTLILCTNCLHWGEGYSKSACTDCGCECNTICTKCMKLCENECCNYCPSCSPKRMTCDEYPDPMWYSCNSHFDGHEQCYYNSDKCRKCHSFEDCFICGRTTCCIHHTVNTPYEPAEEWWFEFICLNCHNTT